MLDATVVVRRLLTRLAEDHSDRIVRAIDPARSGSAPAGRRSRRSDAGTAGHAPGGRRASRSPRDHRASAARPAPLDRFFHAAGRLVARVRATIDHTAGAERALPIAVAVLVLGASVVSVVPVAGGASEAADPAELAGWETPDADATATARLAIAGPQRIDAPVSPEEAAVEPAGAVLGTTSERAASPAPDASPGVSAIPFALDATLIKPVAPETTVVDGSDLLKTYRVKSGDTLSAIASKYGVSTMTLVWSNGLSSKALSVGQRLFIPPVNGAVIKVEETDTLASIAKEFGVDAEKIVAFNKLKDPSVQIGQLLVIPGGRGEMLPPDPTPAPIRITGGNGRGGSSAPSRTTTYAGGRLRWPVGGGYLSQRFHWGHYGIDIAADYGTSVYAAAAGTVIFSGWYRNGGGYQVWISHGSNLYTTYNHMAGVSVGAGAQVAKGTRVGRVGATGIATGPHLHFEVWRGRPWNGGYRVNPLGLF
ncbi:MAG: hypothetical protein RL338_1568 [Chloroflexota bacterium]